MIQSGRTGVTTRAFDGPRPRRKAFSLFRARLDPSAALPHESSVGWQEWDGQRSVLAQSLKCTLPTPQPPTLPRKDAEEERQLALALFATSKQDGAAPCGPQPIWVALRRRPPTRMRRP